jgi:hypothetical protein
MENGTLAQGTFHGAKGGFDTGKQDVGALAADFLSKWPDLASLQHTNVVAIRRFSMPGTLAAWTVSSPCWQSSKPPSR